jgi:hypothetical protein
MGKFKPENAERLSRSLSRLRELPLDTNADTLAETERLVSEGASRDEARRIATKAARMVRGEREGRIVGAKKSGTAPHSVALTDDELAWCVEHGGVSKAVHKALQMAMEKGEG